MVVAKPPRAQGQRTCLGTRVLSGRGTLARLSSSQQSRVPSRRHSGLTRTVVVLQSWCTAEQPGLVLAGMPLICCARFVKEPDRMWAHLSNGRNGTRCLVLHAGAEGSFLLLARTHISVELRVLTRSAIRAAESSSGSRRDCIDYKNGLQNFTSGNFGTSSLEGAPWARQLVPVVRSVLHGDS